MYFKNLLFRLNFFYGENEYLSHWMIYHREKEGLIPAELNECMDVVFDGYGRNKKSKIKEFISPFKMIRKHENEIINSFISAQTNAKAERLNGKIKRFITNNYGVRDKDFVLFRINGFFLSAAKKELTD